MRKVTRAAAWPALCAAMLFIVAPAPGAEAPKLVSLEKQIEYLQDALTEAMVTRDWKMLEMVADGLKAAGLRDLALEVVVLRAERDAAFGARCTAGQVITWGLSCLAKAGDPKALEALRALAKADLPPATPPDVALWRKDAAAANAALKVYQASFAALEKHDEALLCLALLKEPGVAPRALEGMAVKRASQWGGGGVAWGGGGARGDALLEAVLFAEPQEAWGKLIGVLNQEGEKASFDAQVRILQGVIALLPKNRARWAAGGKEGFSVDALAAELLPKDADEQLLKPYTSLLKRAPPDGMTMMGLNPLLYLAYSLPKQEAGSDLLVTLEGLKAKIAANEPNKAYLVQMIDGIVAQHTGKAAPAQPFAPRQAVEPPKAPGEF